MLAPNYLCGGFWRGAARADHTAFTDPLQCCPRFVKRTIPSARATPRRRRSGRTVPGSQRSGRYALRSENCASMEATALLQRVVDEIDAPLFTFDPASALRLVNSAGERLLRQTKTRLLGRNATELGPAAMPVSRQREPGRTKRQWFPSTMAATPKFLPAERSTPHSRRPFGREPRVTGGGAARVAAPDSRARS